MPILPNYLGPRSDLGLQVPGWDSLCLTRGDNSAKVALLASAKLWQGSSLRRVRVRSRCPSSQPTTDGGLHSLSLGASMSATTPSEAVEACSFNSKSSLCKAHKSLHQQITVCPAILDSTGERNPSCVKHWKTQTGGPILPTSGPQH